MRHVELRSRLHRLVSLFKVREGAFDPSVRTFAIGDAGIAVGEPFAGVEAVLGGMAREAAAGAPSASSEGGDQGPSGDGPGRPG
jgi:circadian clock protein KaiC